MFDILVQLVYFGSDKLLQPSNAFKVLERKVR